MNYHSVYTVKTITKVLSLNKITSVNITPRTRIITLIAVINSWYNVEGQKVPITDICSLHCHDASPEVVQYIVTHNLSSNNPLPTTSQPGDLGINYRG